MKVTRTVEMPKSLSGEEIARRFPGYKIIGSGGWIYPVTDTSVVFRSFGWTDLLKQVRDHLKGNQLNIPANLNDQISEWFCREIGGAPCGEEPALAANDLFAQAKRFFSTAATFVGNGMQKTPQEEAERRAAICAACPMNQPDKGFCVGCAMKNLADKTRELVSNWSTSQDEQLQSCDVCGCVLTLKVHIPKDQMDHRELRDKWPSNCWMKS